MGVLGLTPFLLKHYPEVVRTLPDRLRCVRGKTIAVDGTLITQRLHYANIPHKNRHVLGWYRLIREFRRNDVNAICVFDGLERSVAKELEIERRRENKQRDAKRSVLEVYRRDRLLQLRTALEGLHNLPWSEQVGIRNELKTRVKKPVPIPTPPVDQAVFVGDQSLDGDNLEVQDTTTQANVKGSTDRITDIKSLTEDLDTLNIKDDSTLILPGSPTPADLPSGFSDEDRHPSDRADPPSTTENETAVQNVSLKNGVLEMMPTLTALYGDYRASIPSFVASVVSNKDELVEDCAESDVALSKNQHQLVIDEGRLWESILASPPHVTGKPETPFNSVLEEPEDREGWNPLQALHTLINRSTTISQSYERRVPPQAHVYDDSREILSAMGVPIVVVQGPFEAEALASALVIKGYADFVASEDTDVLVYEAPLLRNITNKSEPLVIVSGSDVRACLDLERQAYVDFLLLLGTDFSRRIKNVGPTRALKFIRTHGTIERIVRMESKYPPRESTETYLERVELARTVFDTLPPIPDEETLQQGKYDEAGVRSVMSQFNLNRVLHEDDWSFEEASLSGNYFGDDPTA